MEVNFRTGWCYKQKSLVAILIEIYVGVVLDEPDQPTTAVKPRKT